MIFGTSTHPDGTLRFALWLVLVERFERGNSTVSLWVWLELYRVRAQPIDDASSTAEVIRKGRAWIAIRRVPGYYDW